MCYVKVKLLRIMNEKKIGRWIMRATELNSQNVLKLEFHFIGINPITQIKPQFPHSISFDQFNSFFFFSCTLDRVYQVAHNDPLESCHAIPCLVENLSPYN